MSVATDTVSVFGTTLAVTGAPFCQQDGEFLRCAHAAAWMCSYHAYLRGLVGRHTTAELAQLAPPSDATPERALPSPGLSLNQLQAVFGATGQPALFYGLSNMPKVEGVENPAPAIDASGNVKPPGLWDTRIFSVICRYLNAGFPVLIGTQDHAFVAVGWFRENSRIRFIVCDDQRGPYQTIMSPFSHPSAPWWSIMVPLPPKVYLSGEMAESTAHYLIRAYGASTPPIPAWQALAAALLRKEVSLRTFLRSNAEYKASIPGQRRGEEVTRALRLARLPHWIWVIEAQDRAARTRDRPSVLAEFVFDSTSSDRVPSLDAASVPLLTVTFPPDGGRSERVAGPAGPWKSHLQPQ